jgi:Toprim domain
MKREAPAWEAPGQRGANQSSVTAKNITNGSPRVYTKTVSEILLENRLTIKSAAIGRYYATCPQCSSKRKKAHQRLQCLGVTIGFDGVKFGCNHCGWRGGAKCRPFSGAGRYGSRSPLPAIADCNDERQRKRIALELWNASLNPRNSVVEKYLVRRCGKLPDEIAGRVIRFHPSLKFDGRSVGAMVALYRDIHTDEPCAAHRTFLDDSGNKIGRKMLGRVSGSAIKLDFHEDVTLGLHVGEGIETCLSGYLRGFRPTWCLGSAGPIGDFPVLAGIESLTIFGELGDGGTNRRNAEKCATRWLAADREVLWVRPLIGSDLNDALGGGVCE